MAAPKSRVPLLLGLTAAGGVGYYLYGAGGNAKVAEKDFEHDLSKASAKIKSQVPGKATEMKKEGQLWGAEAGAKVDSAVSSIADKAKSGYSSAEAYAKDAKKDAMKKVDEFDRKTLEKVDQLEKKVDEGAAKAKSWWGGK